MKIINTYGFILDDSPIIISLENHLYSIDDYKYYKCIRRIWCRLFNGRRFKWCKCVSILKS